MLKKSSGTKSKTFGINFENTSVQSVRDIANSYKNQSSIIRIKQVVDGSNVSDSERFSFKTVNETEIKNLLRNLDIKKTSGIDTVPPKLTVSYYHVAYAFQSEYTLYRCLNIKELLTQNRRDI